MDENKFLTERFEANRAHLRSVAYRMLGSRAEADDAVQEAWLRLSRTDTSGVENLSGWLTTVTARVCLDMLRGRKARREEELGPQVPEPVAGEESVEHDMLLADSVGAALLVVLETLEPAERLAFVLHDMFAVPFDAIAPIVGRSPAAARQLASRARRRVQGKSEIPKAQVARQHEVTHQHDVTRQREIVDAFLAASRGGDFDALFAVLDPDVVFRADRAAVQMGGAAELRGAAAVAETFRGRAQAAKPALVDGAVGVAVIMGGRLRIMLRLAIAAGRIATIDAIADPAQLRELDWTILNA
jgi:RNA polymerase sigma-70 factor (ECF subfamily)